MMLTGSEIICECLIEQGVDTVFGYPGGTILNVYDALYRYQDKINHVLTSHEQGASHAADGYARATGKVGVCMATSGPGATNLVTGIATAYMDSTPLVAITANVGVEILGRDSFQEIDITGVTMPITKHNFIVKDIKDLVPTIRKAFYIAKEGRPGPVLVDVTKNVTAEKMEFEPLQPKAIEPKTETYTVEDLDQAIEIIKESEKPFIFAGGGVISSGASQELKEFADRIKILPFVDWKNLRKLISDVDINLAPLEDTIFNRAKSENKWVEASLVQVVTVAANLGAFADTIENQKTGFLCKDLKEWEETLCALIEQPRLRRKIAMQAYQFCKEAYLTTYTGKTLADFIKAKRNKNVGILLPALNISGGIMVAMWHAVFLREAGFDVTILSENTTETSCVFENQKFPVIPLREDAVSGHFDKMIATMWVTVKWLELFSNIDKKYYLVQNYETDFYEKGSPYRAMANATYCKNQIQYVTISKWCKEWLKERFEKECAYAPNGLDTRVFTPCARDFSGKIRILIEGDCGAWHKNVDESFQIVEKLDREKFEIWYLSYNSEPKEWYKPDRFLHKVPFQTVSEVYQQCHILVKSSILESFSYPPLEMMATGGLAVVRPNGGNKEYLRDGENCLLYEPENISEAVEKIMELAENETLRKHLTEGGLKTARQREWETVKQQILNLYLEAGE